MSAVMWSDLITCKTMLKQQLLIATIVALAVSIPTGSVTVVCPTVAVAMTMSAAVSVVALDERNGWEGFRSCMPLSRADVIRGRMGFIALLALASVALGLVLSVIISAAVQLAGPAAGIDPSSYCYEGLDLVFTACVSLLVLAFALGVTMPLVARFGMTGAVRFVSLVWVALFIVAFLAIGYTPLGSALMSALDVLLTNAPWLACVLVVAVAAALYLLSTAISTKLYQHREF
ncbi:MAG: ABC-2 transporter permease [Coriobacteriales bacterium]